MSMRRRTVYIGSMIALVAMAMLLSLRSPSRQIDADRPIALQETQGSSQFGQYELKLTNYKSQPMADIVVSLAVDEPTATALKVNTSDSNGLVGFYDLEPTTYRVELNSPTLNPIRIADLPHRIKIKAGEKKEESLGFLSYPPNSPPALTIHSPTKAERLTKGQSYTVRYSANDSEENLRVAFYLDTDRYGFDGKPVNGSCASTHEGNIQECSLGTTGWPVGQYYLYGELNDGINIPLQSYAVGALSITPPAPVLTITQPDGKGSTIDAQGSFEIRYQLADTDSPAQVSFYYDTDNRGGNGKVIDGCKNRRETSNGSCQWNTGRLAPNRYFIYGVATDGAQSVTVYSSEPINITPAPPEDLRGTSAKAAEVQLLWRNRATGATGYEIERADSPSTNFNSVSKVGPNSTGFIDKNLTSGKRYRYRIRAYTSIGSVENFFSPYSSSLDIKAR